MKEIGAVSGTGLGGGPAASQTATWDDCEKESKYPWAESDPKLLNL